MLNKDNPMIPEDCALGSPVVVVGCDGIGRLKGFKEGAFFTSAIVDLGGQAVITHIAAVRLPPLFVCEGRPVFQGSVLWVVDEDVYWKTTVNCMSPSGGVRNTPSDIYEENPMGVSVGECSIDLFTWQEPKELIAKKGKLSGSPGAPMYVNVYSSIPHGKRLFPGSCIFSSATKAAAAKHFAQLVGTYKLVEES